MGYKALLLHNRAGHPSSLVGTNPHITFLLPPNTSLLQPFDKGLIVAFKAYYTGLGEF